MKPKYSLWFIFFHGLAGFLVSQNQSLSMIWGIAIIFIALYQIVVHRNRNNEAAIFAAYYVGLEVLLRSTGGNITYEIAKYVVIFFLVVGLFVEKKPITIPRAFFLYFILLLPAFSVIDFPSFEDGRKRILFNLSGPFTIIASCFYFYKRTLTSSGLQNILFSMVLPIFSFGVYLFFDTPDLSNINFTSESNFATSGGFGPNQVSSIFGLGIFVIGLGLLLKWTISGYYWLDILVFLLLSFRGLLTFSRGGIMTGAISILGALLVIMIFNRSNLLNMKLVLAIVAVIFFSFVAWFRINEISNGALEARYKGENIEQPYREEEPFLTGRVEIINTELEAFFQYPILGLGVGMGNQFRAEAMGEAANSHTEFTRLLAEHGFYGLIALLILFFTPVVYFFNSTNFNKIFIISFCLMGLLTMFHGAMRLALPGFLYGMSFFAIKNQYDIIFRK